MKRLSISQAWNEAAPFLRRHGGTLFTITFAFAVLPTLLMQVLAPQTTPGQQPQPGPWLLLLIPVMVGSVVASLAVSTLAIGRETVVRAALGHALRRFLPVFATVLLLVTGFVLVSAPVLALAGPNPADPASFGLGFLLFALVGVFFWTRFMLLNPVAAAEPLGPIALIRRSWSITRGQFWRLLGFFLLAVLAFVIVSLAALAVFGIVIVLLAGRPEPGSLSSFLTLLLNGALSALFATMLSTMLARIYVQLAGDAPTSGI